MAQNRIQLPEELVEMIAKSLRRPDLAHFMRASRQTYRIGYPVLYSLGPEDIIKVFEWTCRQEFDTVAEYLIPKVLAANKEELRVDYRALCRASLYGRCKLVQQFLAHNVPVDMDSVDANPLTLATQSDHPDVVKLLIEAGADLSTVEPSLTWDDEMVPAAGRESIMHCAADWWSHKKAAKSGHLPAIEALIAQNATINAASEVGYTSLHVAAMGRHSPVVQALLAAGAESSVRGVYIEPPLITAAMYSDVETARILLDHGADIEERANETNRTALSMAVEALGNRGEILEQLIACGADVNSICIYGRTPLSYATQIAPPGLTRYTPEEFLLHQSIMYIGTPEADEVLQLLHDARSQSSARRPVPRKRVKYTRVACVICKTRKVRCSGQLPCSRCLELQTECKYQQCDQNGPNRTTQSDTKREPIPKDLGELLRTMRELCGDIESSASQPRRSRGSTFPLRRRFCNVVTGTPTVDHTPSPDFVRLLNQVKSNVYCFDPIHDPTYTLEPRSPPGDRNTITSTTPVLQAAAVLFELGRENVYKYWGKYLDYVQPAYPCLDPDVGNARLESLFKASKTSVLPEDLGCDLIDVDITKVVVSIAMAIEGDNDHPLCKDLWSHIIWDAQPNTSNELSQIEDVMMATLLTIDAILRNEELKAWRMIGIAARACLELGLHGYKPSEDRGIGFSKVLFACVYDLDKRCSFFANLPWTLQDKDIDVGVLSPDDKHPFLSAMIALDGIHTEVLKSSSFLVPTGGNRELDEQREILDYRAQKLADNFTAHGLFRPYSEPFPSPAVQHVMESFIQLRAHQIRILAHMPYIMTPGAVSHRYLLQQQVVSLVISATKQCLSLSCKPGLDRASRLFKPIIDRLLLNAVSCMLLAVSQDSARYGQICSPVFNEAIRYLGQSYHKTLHADSWSVDDLRLLGEKMQMPSPKDQIESINPELPANNATALTEDSLGISAQELANVCDATNQDTLLDILGSSFAWENVFQGPQVI
ncbi:hypothetical protein BJY01DRAFT_245789 [Aspergillus pseudoustus]|uniref:Zn(2)-C6 fungal-type domain-containing protein n=1 Tax=Aspergillus pseudoustus TaxID=1810923 RepID=A0ABR4KEV0_9EURO